MFHTSTVLSLLVCAFTRGSNIQQNICSTIYPGRPSGLCALLGRVVCWEKLANMDRGPGFRKARNLLLNLNQQRKKHTAVARWIREKSGLTSTQEVFPPISRYLYYRPCISGASGSHFMNVWRWHLLLINLKLTEDEEDASFVMHCNKTNPEFKLCGTAVQLYCCQSPVINTCLTG